MSLASLFLIVALLAQASAAGQQAPPTPPRDQKPAGKSGSGVIRGRVIDATSGAPVGRASIRAFAPDLRDNTPSTVSNDEGRFELRDVPAGKFTVTAQRAPYVGGLYGQTRANGPGSPIEMREGAVVENIVIRMTRGGVITGRVMDDAGNPAINVNVLAMRYQYGPNGRSLESYGGTVGIQTDDLGQFRLYALSAGQYIVAARVESSYMFNPVGYGDSGPITTYFPNAAEPEAAQRVTVAAGKETGPILITLVSTRLSKVRGRALMSDGQPFVGSFVNVTIRETNGWSSRPGNRTRPDGSFEIDGLAPGTYDLEVHPANSLFPDDDAAEIARGTVSVAGDDVENVLLIGGPMAKARGKVTTDDGSPLPTGFVHVSAQPPPGAGRSSFSSARTNADHTFELKGLMGPRYIRANVDPAATPGAQWTLRSVLHDGVDITDKPIDFQPGQAMEDLEVVLTQKVTELSGTITVDAGAALDDTWVVLFPADETLWREAFRFVRGTRPDKEGTYRFRMLAPYDDYLLVSAVGIEPNQWLDPEFLRSVRDRALRLSIALGEQKVQNIRMAPSP
jgi:hypothetical protein